MEKFKRMPHGYRLCDDETAEYCESYIANLISHDGVMRCPICGSPHVYLENSFSTSDPTHKMEVRWGTSSPRMYSIYSCNLNHFFKVIQTQHDDQNKITWEMIGPNDKDVACVFYRVFIDKEDGSNYVFGIWEDKLKRFYYMKNKFLADGLFAGDYSFPDTLVQDEKSFEDVIYWFIPDYGCWIKRW